MDASFVFRLPKEIFYGSGELRETGKIVKKLGKRALVVCGKSAARSTGFLSLMEDSLGSARIPMKIFEGVEPEPSLETVDRGISEGMQWGCDMVISLGGGSVLDCGKAIAGVLGNGESVIPFFKGEPLLKPGCPWIAVPTTAGTGSEMTNNAVLTDRARKLKQSLRSPYLMARVVVTDPLLTHSMNPYLTATSGVDAIVQAIEAYTSPRSNPVSDVLGLEAVALLWSHLPEAVRRGDDHVAREKVARGSMLSAMSFANSSSGPAHGLSHIVGPEFGVVHGEACGVFLPHVIRFNAEILRERYARLADTLGIPSHTSDRAVGVADALEQLMKEIGLRTRLSDWGITERMLDGVVREEAVSRNIRENPRPIDKKGIEELLRRTL